MSLVKSIKVLVVDDSLLFRETLKNKLSEEKTIDVIGVAVDSSDAYEKIKQLKPDVVTLDVEMPGLNGIDFLKKLIPEYPIPVVVVSSAPITALDALQAGAVDFVRKPRVQSQTDFNAFISELIVKIKIGSIAKVRQASKPVQRAFNSQSTDREAKPVHKPTVAPSTSVRNPIFNRNVVASDKTVIAIGASTGGTEAIIEVVKDLPASTPGIVIVQHMPAGFTKMYSERLNRICKMSVKEAEDGDRVVTGQIIVAAGEFHMRLKKDAKGYYVSSKRGEKVSGHCPSVDVLFESVADTAGKDAYGVILTGMGADGARGMLKMRQKGAYTIGQDKDSCVVYGMPMVAFNNGGVAKQLPLEQIGEHLLTVIK